MSDALKRNKPRIFAAVLLVAVMGLSIQAKSQLVERPLFLDQSTLAVEIKGPLSTLMRERSDSEYLDGKLSYTDDSGAVQTLDLRFRARGNYRRRKSTCWFPPVRLNVGNKQTEGTLFAGQNILKIVTHCKPSSKRYEQYVLKEYLAYRILQLHTPYSFNVRLLKIRWIDTDKDNKAIDRYGFVIQHKNKLAEDHGAKVAEFTSTTHSRLDRKQASIVSVFQYLIGNTDYSLVKAIAGESCCHNAILVSKEGGDFISIPYDFDFAGIVNAPYAEPNPRFPIKSVTTRYYRGHCSVNSKFLETRALFERNKEAVLDLIANQEGLEEKRRRRTLIFVGKFYTQLADRERIEKKFARECF